MSRAVETRTDDGLKAARDSQRHKASRTETRAVIGLAAWATFSGLAIADEPTPDPFEPFNRAMFAVHEAVDKAALEPLARGYEAITPGPVREGVGNALDNLKAPVILANDILQLEPKRAATTTMRFIVNSTLGLGGLFDVAHEMGLEKHDEDFGQTLAKYGVSSGPYLFVPVLGPTTLRDGIGRGVDAALDPLNSNDYRNDDQIRTSRGVLTGLQTRADILGAVDELRAESDPYLTIRGTYLLLRDSEIRNGKAELPDVPDLPPLPPSEAESPPLRQPTQQ